MNPQCGGTTGKDAASSAVRPQSSLGYSCGWKLISSPSLRRPVIRVDGICKENPKFNVRELIDPRGPPRYRSICDVELAVPLFAIDCNTVRIPPKHEVSILGLNDNINEHFLVDMCRKFGEVTDYFIYHHPRTKKHLGMASVLFSEPACAELFIKKYDGTSVMGNNISCFFDPFASKIGKRYEDIAMESPPIPKYLRHISEERLSVFKLQYQSPCREDPLSKSTCSAHTDSPSCSGIANTVEEKKTDVVDCFEFDVHSSLGGIALSERSAPRTPPFPMTFEHTFGVNSSPPPHPPTPPPPPRPPLSISPLPSAPPPIPLPNCTPGTPSFGLSTDFPSSPAFHVRPPPAPSLPVFPPPYMPPAMLPLMNMVPPFPPPSVIPRQPLDPVFPSAYVHPPPLPPFPVISSVPFTSKTEEAPMDPGPSPCFQKKVREKRSSSPFTNMKKSGEHGKERKRQRSTSSTTSFTSIADTVSEDESECSAFERNPSKNEIKHRERKRRKGDAIVEKRKYYRRKSGPEGSKDYYKEVVIRTVDDAKDRKEAGSSQIYDSPELVQEVEQYQRIRKYKRHKKEKDSSEMSKQCTSFGSVDATPDVDLPDLESVSSDEEKGKNKTDADRKQHTSHNSQRFQHTKNPVIQPTRMSSHSLTDMRLRRKTDDNLKSGSKIGKERRMSKASHEMIGHRWSSSSLSDESESDEPLQRVRPRHSDRRLPPRTKDCDHYSKTPKKHPLNGDLDLADLLEEVTESSCDSAAEKNEKLSENILRRSNSKMSRLRGTDKMHSKTAEETKKDFLGSYSGTPCGNTSSLTATSSQPAYSSVKPQYSSKPPTPSNVSVRPSFEQRLDDLFHSSSKLDTCDHASPVTSSVDTPIASATPGTVSGLNECSPVVTPQYSDGVMSYGGSVIRDFTKVNEHWSSYDEHVAHPSAHEIECFSPLVESSHSLTRSSTDVLFTEDSKGLNIQQQQDVANAIAMSVMRLQREEEEKMARKLEEERKQAEEMRRLEEERKKLEKKRGFRDEYRDKLFELYFKDLLAVNIKDIQMRCDQSSFNALEMKWKAMSKKSETVLTSTSSDRIRNSNDSSVQQCVENDSFAGESSTTASSKNAFPEMLRKLNAQSKAEMSAAFGPDAASLLAQDLIFGGFGLMRNMPSFKIKKKLPKSPSIDHADSDSRASPIQKRESVVSSDEDRSRSRSRKRFSRTSSESNYSSSSRDRSTSSSSTRSRFTNSSRSCSRYESRSPVGSRASSLVKFTVSSTRESSSTRSLSSDDQNGEGRIDRNDKENVDADNSCMKIGNAESESVKYEATNKRDELKLEGREIVVDDIKTETASHRERAEESAQTKQIVKMNVKLDEDDFDTEVDNAAHVIEPLSIAATVRSPLAKHDGESDMEEMSGTSVFTFPQETSREISQKSSRRRRMENELASLLPPPVDVGKLAEFVKTWSHRSQTEEDEIERVFERSGFDGEDLDMLEKALHEMQTDGTANWSQTLLWVPPLMIPETILLDKPKKVGKFDLYYSDPELVGVFPHSTGCARTQGFYRLSNKQKRGLVRRPEAFQDKTVISERDETTVRHQVQATKEARSMTRRLLTSMGETTQSDFFKVNQLKYRKKMIKFARSRIHGWGLYALEPIAPDDMIIEYIGQKIRPTVADLREKQYEKRGMGSSYLFRIDSDNVIDATQMGNFARFINHSCQPNCYAKVVTVDGEKRIVIYSKVFINKGDEITYDYKFPIEDDKIDCLCGAPGCRGTLN
ncbi:hypothetical protein AB6A40_004021 [Gnathostoma spinigerum]|uniref:[histone H3]-lysine(4) N-trimethyltransferase n=1 Tax=Gnathostoma spinigerum TaxID=75299 RepID=A0ABD6EKT1_9BILA